MPPSVLLVEDDLKLASLLAEYLRKSGFEVAVAHRGRAALEQIRAAPPEAIVLDWMLPEMDGISICRRIRDRYHGPILILTARNRAEDQVRALESGADDFVSKPVDPRVLVARIHTRLRSRAHEVTSSASHCSVGRLALNHQTREAFLEDRKLSLTGLEFDTLWLLATHAGSVVTRDVLYQSVRGVPYDGEDRGMDIHIFRLRRKLDELDPANRWIQSVRGEGYLLTKRD